MAWAPDYITSAQLKAFVRIGDTVDDVQVAVAITASSRAIDLSTNRQFGLVASAEQRFYTGQWDRQRCRWVVEIDDLMTVTGFVAETQDAEGTTVGSINDYVLEPRNAAAKSRPWTQMVIRPNSAFKPNGVENEVAVTGRWGWTTVPTAVEHATYLQSSRFLSRRDSPFGIAGSPDVGSELRLLARLDPDVAVSLGSYTRWWAGS
jgi:hypothetical protein